MRVFPSYEIEVLHTQDCNLNCKYCFEKDKKALYKKFNVDDLINALTDENQFLGLCCSNLKGWGGEPFLDFSFIENIVSKIQQLNCSEYQKNCAIERLLTFTTNGTLLTSKKEEIENYQPRLVVSLDGPKEINDINRVDRHGKGTYDSIISNTVDLLTDENYRKPISFHLSLDISSYSSFSLIIKHFCEIMLFSLKSKNKNITEFSSYEEKMNSLYFKIFRRNFFQFVYNNSILDSDIDNLLTEYEKIVNYLLTDDFFKELKLNDKKVLVADFLTKCWHTYDNCGRGLYSFCYDSDLNMFSCVMDSCNKDSNIIGGSSLGNLKDESTINYRQLLQIQDLHKRREIYGFFSNVYNFKPIPMSSICIIENKNSGDIFHRAPFMDALFTELKYYIPELAKEYNIDLSLRGYIYD